MRDGRCRRSGCAIACCTHKRTSRSATPKSNLYPPILGGELLRSVLAQTCLPLVDRLRRDPNNERPHCEAESYGGQETPIQTPIPRYATERGNDYFGLCQIFHLRPRFFLGVSLRGFHIEPGEQSVQRLAKVSFPTFRVVHPTPEHCTHGVILD